MLMHFPDASAYLWIPHRCLEPQSCSACCGWLRSQTCVPNSGWHLTLLLDIQISAQAYPSHSLCRLVGHLLGNFLVFPFPAFTFALGPWLNDLLWCFSAIILSSLVSIGVLVCWQRRSQISLAERPDWRILEFTLLTANARWIGVIDNIECLNSLCSSKIAFSAQGFFFDFLLPVRQ